MDLALRFRRRSGEPPVFMLAVPAGFQERHSRIGIGAKALEGSGTDAEIGLVFHGAVEAADGSGKIKSTRFRIPPEAEAMRTKDSDVSETARHLPSPVAARPEEPFRRPAVRQDGIVSLAGGTKNNACPTEETADLIR